MNAWLPRIASVRAEAPATLFVRWESGGKVDRVDLSGWIATGGELLAPLSQGELFIRPYVGEYGAAVAWDDNDLLIDAFHLWQIAAEQKPFEASDASAWQEDMDLSNNEAADLLGISLSTWNAYKAGSSAVPPPISMICRAAQRDPIIVQAHLRRRKAGRPRRAPDRARPTASRPRITE